MEICFPKRYDEAHSKRHIIIRLIKVEKDCVLTPFLV